MKRLTKFAFSIAITLLTLYFLFKSVNLLEIKKYFYFDWRILILVLFLFGIIKLINTIRYSSVYGFKISKKLYLILCSSNLFLSIFPFRFGEISYLSYFKKHYHKKYSESTPKLVKIRLFDYITIYLLLLLSSIWAYSKFSNIIQLVSIFFIATLVLGAIFSIFILRLKLSKKIKFSKIKNMFRALENELDQLSYKNLPKELLLLAVSIIYWSLRLFMGYLVLNLLGIKLSFFLLSFISLAVFMLSLIPIQFIGGFGITEAGFMFFLTQLGFEYNSTLITILLYHVYLLIPVLVYGIISFIILNLRKETINSN